VTSRVRVTDEFYDKFKTELSSQGIYIKQEDLFILIKMVFKNLSLVLDEKDKEVCIDRSVNIFRNKQGNIIIRYNRRLFKVHRRIDMTDRGSQRILEHIFLPMLERELNEN
jgi:hypothetical protein